MTIVTPGTVAVVINLLTTLAAWFQRTFNLTIGKALLHAAVFLGNSALAAA